MTKLGGGAEVSTTTGEAVAVGAAAAATAEEETEEEETAVSMPAATLAQTDADTGVTVTVAAPEGAFPKGVTMTVETVDGTDAEAFLTAVAEQDFAQYDETYTVVDAAILDISFYANGAEVQPATEVEVTISGLTLATDGADYALVYHMDDEGVVEYVEADQNEQVGKDSYTFTASSFSEYGVVNVSVEYGISLAAVASVSNATDTISYSYSSGSGWGSGTSTQSITVHFVDSTGAALSTATITATDLPTSFSGTVTLSDLAGYYTVVVGETTYYYNSGLVSTSASYSSANTAVSFRYNNQWQYRKSSSSNWTSLGNNWSNPAITDIYLVYTDTEYTEYSGNTVDHIDLSIYPTATLTINGKELTTTITLTNSNFYVNGVATNTWGLTAYDSSGNSYSYSVSGMSAGGSTGQDGTQQVRFEGTFPVGTLSDPVYYTFWFTTSVTFTDSDTNETYTVDMTFFGTFSYWDNDNNCPGLPNNWSTTTNKTFQGSSSGMDFTLSATHSGGTVSIVKEVRGADGSYLSVASENFTVSLWDATGNDGNTGNDENVDTKAIELSKSSIGYVYYSEAVVGDYYVVESTPAASVTGTDGNTYNYIKTVTYYVATTYDSSGNVTATNTSNSLDSLTSAKAEVDSTTSVTFYVVNYYGDETTEVTVTKAWDDDGDAYGLRPESVTVTLLDGGTTYSGENATVTLNAENNWTYTWEGLPKDGTYTVQEGTVSNYSSVTTGNATDGYTITNTLDTGDLTLTKTVKADGSIDTSSMTFTFYVRGFGDGVTSVSDGTNTYPVTDGVAAVTVPANGSVTLKDIPVGSYTVYETNGTTITANGYTWTVSGGGEVTVTKGETASATITNTVTGTATLYITKNWVDASNKWNTRPETSSFTVTITATGKDNKTYTYETTAAWSESTNTWTIDLTGVTVYDTEGNKLIYTVKESEVEGYTLDKVTVSGSGINKTDYTGDDVQYASITPAEGYVNITLQNSLDTASVKVTKTLKNSSGGEITNAEYNDDNFTMQLYTYEYDEDTQTGTYTEVAAHTLTLSDVMTYTFSDLPLGTYYLKEVLAGTNDHAYTVTVTVGGTTVTANTDGYYVIYLTTADATVEVSVTNQEQEINIQDQTGLFPAVTKTYTSDSITTSEETTFTFYIMDTSGSTVATGTATTSIGATDPAKVIWTYTTGAFTYTEVGTYVYTIREYNSGAAGVKYDDTVYTLVVTVSTDSDGKLTSSYEIYTIYNGEGDSGNVAVSGKTASFTNTYSPSEINFFMIVRKVLTGRTIKEGEFSVILQEYKYENGTYTEEGSAITVTNGADSTFSRTFTYSSEGTYYYKAYEQKGTETGMTYDSKTSWIKVVVGSEGNVLKVTSVEWVQFDEDKTPDSDTTWTAYSGTLSDYVAFQNTYTATGTGTLSTYKVMEGRDFNAGETFTFTITALDTGAPALTNPNITGVDFADNNDGTYTVKVTVPDDVEDGTTILNWTLASISVDQDDVGEWVYRVTEAAASDTNGMTLDTATYGHLITVTVADKGDGTLSVTPESTNNTDWNKDGTTDTTSSVIVNTFDQGSTTIYGTKVWVDGNLEHDNSQDVTLTLYYSTDGGETWTKYTDSYTSGYTVVWGTLNTNNWHIENLPVYSKDGKEITYKVEETYNGSGSYTTTYNGADEAGIVPSTNSDTSRYTITNTITQQYIPLTGTKTWIDGGLQHNNSAEVTLIVTRSSASTETITLVSGTDYTVSWSNNDYTITGTGDGLPQYDQKGYEYTYTVTEKTNEDGQITVTIDDVTYTYEVTYDNEGNIINTRQPEEPTVTKTETYVNEITATKDATSGYYNEVSVGDTITYAIEWYNGNNTAATVTITDPLDSGVDYESSTADGVYNSATHTVTWTIEAEAFAHGTVTLTVKVNENAKTLATGETAATVENTAEMTVTGDTYYTDTVVNPLEDEEETPPTKTLISIWDLEEGTESEDEVYVSVGDRVTYRIGYTNNTASVQTVYIVDTLDTGVDYYGSSAQGVYYADGTTIGEITVPARSVVWTITVQPFTSGDVYLYVTVNENAKASVNDYDVADGYSLTYGVNDDTTASIANQATVYIGNSNATYTEVVENPLEPEDPTDPTKTVDVGDEDTTDNDADDTVAVGDLLTYTIGYYNNLSEATTVTIVDALDDGVDFISASAGGVYDETAHTVTWTILNATPLTAGTVTLQVQVNENAKTTESGETDATVENQADVTVGEVKNSTEIVVNPIDPDEPSDPEKVVSAASEAGVSGANVAVGDQITYTISYYNHNNTAAAVTIVDALDEYVDFVSATAGGVYDEATHTVTWTIDSVSAFTGGTVDLTVEVNSTAVTQVENDAVVTIGDNDYTTNLVTTPVDDEPEDPVKTVDTDGDEDFEDDGATVSVGDEITYVISYYNYYAVEADIAITDQLDPGVEFVSATDQTGATLTAEDVFADEEDTYVKWPTFTAEAYERGTVTLTVRVTEAAKTADSTGDATVDNQAVVTIGENAYTTNIVANPLTPDDPTEPVKTVNVGADTQVAVGDTLVYTISYYNNNSTSATVTITDVLEDGLTWVSGGTLGADGKTVTWTIEAAAYEAGTVTLTAQVNESAAGDKVVNTASVQIGNAAAVSTDPVTNDVEEVPVTPSPTPSADPSATPSATPASGEPPKTGDDASLGLWIAILAAGALGLACVTVVTASRKKRSGK
ncbi:MAG: Cna B-type domain-containing protein [Oscillospiraceae bacterium]|nr:Cna B-type domain-containing protein [Oscillospiraceae bacterium]